MLGRTARSETAASGRSNDGPSPRSGRRSGGMLTIGTALAAACLVLSPGAGTRAAAEQPGRPAVARKVVDPAVQPAGGACRGCRDGHCRTCRPGAGHGHHAGCRDGKCHAYCPVRPQEFGFYGTQWRRWPGQGVVPVANVQEATPVRPPKSAVPGPEAEGRRVPADELPTPEPTDQPPAAEPEAPLPVAPRPVAPPPPPEPAPPTVVEPPASARPALEDPVAPAPAPEPPAKAPAADDNLFDESSTGPVPRRFVAGRAAAAIAAPDARPAVRPTTLTYPDSVERLPASTTADPLRVPRVPFDPAAESARLRR